MHRQSPSKERRVTVTRADAPDWIALPEVVERSQCLLGFVGLIAPRNLDRQLGRCVILNCGAVVFAAE
jgi:hypothetical protein